MLEWRLAFDPAIRKLKGLSPMFMTLSFEVRRFRTIPKRHPSKFSVPL